jgi:hypothetical protein
MFRSEDIEARAPGTDVKDTPLALPATELAGDVLLHADEQ